MLAPAPPTRKSRCIEGSQLMRIHKNRNTFYASENGEYVHRAIMNAQPGQIVDHINHNGLDNRPENLRFVTRGQNRQRSQCKPQGESGYFGVSRQKRGWKAVIWHDNKHYYLGYFHSPEDAARAYDKAAMEKFGPYCKTNFPT